MLDRTLRFFNSLKLTLVLIVTVALLSSIGTFIPQGEDNSQQLIDKYGQSAFDHMHALGVDDVYRSWWFMAVLLLVTLNFIACTLIRLPRVWRLSRSLQEEASAEAPELSIFSSSFHQEFKSPLPAEEVRRKGSAILEAEFGALRGVAGQGAEAVIGEKNWPALWGAYIVHVGLLLLLLAGALKVTFGYSKYVQILEGTKAYVPSQEMHAGLWLDWMELPSLHLSLPLPRFFIRAPSHHFTQIQLDHFELQYYKDTVQPSLFRSDVQILEPGKAPRKASIAVNDPLSLGSDLIYQSSYGYDGLNAAAIDVKLPGSEDIYQVVAPYRKRFKLLDSGWELEITDFYPDADMASPGKLVQVSAQLNNPAVRLRFYQHGVERAHFWFVYAVPDIQMSKIKGLEVRGKSVDPVAFTLLQVNHDPGVPYALAGALVVLLGLFISFYLSWQKAWFVVSPEGTGSRVRIVGQCKHNKLSFKRKFAKLVTAFETALGA
jgi:cytochrome c biogenesis protein